MIVKVCRVINLHSARFCADMGADMLGLHVIRGASAARLNRLSRVSREIALYYPNVTVVLVTKLRDAASIAFIMRRLEVRIVQLHYPLATRNWTNLCRAIEGMASVSIAALRVFSSSDVTRSTFLRGAKRMNRFTAYFLIDSSWRGGTGTTAELGKLCKIISILGHKKSLIAGGLSATNVLHIVRKVRPGGVDIQSGLERRDRKRDKDPMLVRSFMDTVKGKDRHTSFEIPPRPVVSCAVAGVDDKQANDDLMRLCRLDVDTIHFDHSDGSMAPQFFSAPVSVAHTLHNVAPCLPYDLHLFVRQAQQCIRTIELYLSRNPLLRLAVLHIGSIEDARKARVRAVSSYVRASGIGFAVALHAPKFTPNTIGMCLRVVEPFAVKGICLITHSGRHSLERISQCDVPLFSELRKWAGATSFPGHLGLDRNMTCDKLKLFTSMRPNEVVVGAALRNAARPQALVSRLRRYLSCRAETVA